LVVGETARSDHFSLNGYARATNSQLAKETVLSFTNAWSCGTNTAVSVPCMFSHLGKAAFEDSDVRYETLLDVLQRAGMAVVWIDNQAGCKGVCDRVPTVNTAALQDPNHCSTGECRDAVMLTVIDAEIAKLPAVARAKGVVVVMHQMGSHGPAYYKRSSPQHKTFQPECTNNALNVCDTAHVVNAYDNTIVATDDFLAQTIAWLKGKSASHRAAMMYVSDHGESLGENNVFLHGLPYRIAPDAQKRVPWVVWRAAPVTGCPSQFEATKLTHDAYFHTVLGMLDVTTRLYKPELDVFKVCGA
jgi:lipid A ethanolaminephosphotransferase